jgi:photosystem II stability/assembly factor-like uncharacterized protein
MKKNFTLIVFLSFCFFAKTTSAQTWASSTISLTPITNLQDIHFFDDNNGIVIGSASLIAKTTDGGSSWTKVTFSGTKQLNELHFVNNNYGWIAGNDAIYKTRDGGNTWFELPKTGMLTGTFNFTDVHFVDTNNGYVCGSSIIFKTNNGGNTWDTLGTSIATIRSIDLPNSLTVYGCGAYAGIGKISLGIKTFNTIPGTSVALNKIRFKESIGIVVGDSNTIIRINKAEVVSALPIRDSFLLKSVCSPMGDYWWTVGSKGRIMASTDSGKTWVTEGVGITSQLLNNVFFRNNNLGWAVGENGVLLKYTNSTSISEQVATSKLSIFPNPASNVVSIENIVANTVVSICDLTGKTIVTKKASSSQMDMDISGFANGFYLVQASLNGQYLGQSKLIISK